MKQKNSRVATGVLLFAIIGITVAVVTLPTGTQGGSTQTSKFRNTSLSPNEQARADQNAKISQSIEKALDRNDLATAETGTRQLILYNSGTDFYYKELGDILFLEGRKNEARQAYKRLLHDPKTSVSDPDLFVRYGELAYAAGDAQEARTYYQMVLPGHASEFIGKLAAQISETMSVPELHATALALEAGFYRGSWQSGEYDRRTLAAIAAEPHSFIAQMSRADALYMAGHLADSRLEFDSAVQQAPSVVRSEIEPWIDKTYSFHSWDHTSVGVIKNGKVTITYSKTPLPNHLIDRGRYGTSTPAGPKRP